MPRKIDIKHYRGDSYEAVLSIDDYEPVATDEILFGIKVSPDADDYILRKSIDPLSMYVKLTSEEMQVMPEKSYYDAQITFSDVEGESFTKTFIYGKFKCIKDVVK